MQTNNDVLVNFILNFKKWKNSKKTFYKNIVYRSLNDLLLPTFIIIKFIKLVN